VRRRPQTSDGVRGGCGCRRIRRWPQCASGGVCGGGGWKWRSGSVYGGGDVVAVAPEVRPRWATIDGRWASTVRWAGEGVGPRCVFCFFNPFQKSLPRAVYAFRHKCAERICWGSRHRALCRPDGAECPVPRASSRQSLCREETILCREHASSDLHSLIQLPSTFGSTKAAVSWLGGKRVWSLVITIPGDSILACPPLTALRWEPRRSGVRVALVDASMRPANIGKLLYGTRGSLKKMLDQRH
jgi:hypothetical protein